MFNILNSMQTKQIYWIFFEEFPTNTNTRNSLVIFLKIFQHIGTTTVCVCVRVPICDPKRKLQAVKLAGHPVPLRAFLGSYPKVGNGGNMGPTKTS